VNIASAPKFNLPLPGSLPPPAEQNYSLNEFETTIELNAVMNELGNLLARRANEIENIKK
jgi:hypothetical protein